MMMMIIIVIIIIIITYNKSTFFSAPIFTEPTNAVESHALMYFFLYGASARLGRDSVRLHWTSDQPDAETSTRQQTTLTKETDIQALRGVRTRNPSKRKESQTHTFAATGIGLIS